MSQAPQCSTDKSNGVGTVAVGSSIQLNLYEQHTGVLLSRDTRDLNSNTTAVFVFASDT